MNGLAVSGPSLAMVSSYITAIEAFRYCQKLIQTGRAESAIVVMVNLIHFEEISYGFSRRGVLSDDGVTKCFADDGINLIANLPAGGIVPFCLPSLFYLSPGGGASN